MKRTDTIQILITKFGCHYNIAYHNTLIQLKQTNLSYSTTDLIYFVPVCVYLDTLLTTKTLPRMH